MEDTEKVEVIDENTDDSTDNDISQSETEEVKTFTQDQVNKLIAKEKKKVKEQYKGYDTLKQENEDLRNKTKEATDKAKTTEQKLMEEKQDQSITKASNEFGLDVTLANKLLDKSLFKLADDGSVSNAKELVQSLIEQHPQLVKKVAPVNDVVVNDTSKTEAPKYSLWPNYGNNFFSGGGVVPVNNG